jgi:putative salt-induced outer membrane protein YdiY
MFLLLLLAAPLSVLAAQDRPTRFTADLGFVNAAGNTDVTSINLGEQVTHTSGAWKLQQVFAALYGRTDGEKSAEQFRLGARGDYALSARMGVYAQAGWDRNQFAGITRRFEEGLGLAFKALTGPRDELSLEGGVGATQQVNTSDVSSSFLTGRAAGRYQHQFAEKTFLRQVVEFLPNFETSDDYRLFSETSLVAPLSGAVALKAAYVVRFDNLPEPGFKKTDRLLTTGIQLNW